MASEPQSSSSPATISYDVLLLKDPQIPVHQDPYHIALSTSSSGISFSPHFISVLQTDFVDLDELQNIITDGGAGKFSGVVFTSQRSVEAWSLAGSAGSGIDDSDVRKSQLSSRWTNTPFFAVGPATSSAILRLDPSVRPEDSRLVMGGAESGTGELLAKRIVDLFQSSRTGGEASQKDESQVELDSSLPLLYLVGDKTRGELPQILQDAGISTRRTQVYATGPTKDFESKLNSLLDSLPTTRKKLDWVVFFSPSGVNASLDALKKSARLLSPSASSEADPTEEGRLKIASIGPTTGDYLREKFEIVPDCVAAKPQPSALVDAMVKVHLSEIR